MWQAYLTVIRKKASQAIHVLDRFHVMQLLLKRPENLTDNQAVKLSELLKYNLRSIRSYLMKEDFQRFWEYSTARWAGKFLDQWCTRAMKSKLEPMKKVSTGQI